jgi:hypothetical protein
VFFCAAPWRHVCRVLHREGELATQARVAHAVATGKLDGLVNGQLVVHTDKTVDPMIVSTCSISCLALTDMMVSLCTGVVGVRGGLAKRFANIPPVLRRAISRPECVLAMAGGEGGCFIVLVLRTVGLAVA